MVSSKIKPTIIDKLHQVKESLYTGKLEIATEQGQSWRFYFRLGRLIWCQGGANEEEQWKRNLADYCPQSKRSHLELKSPDKKYDCLADLYQQKLLNKENLVALTKNLAQEIIFDIIQFPKKGDIYFQESQGEIPKILLSLVELDSILKLVQENWQAWEEAGLANYSPNLYPFVQDEKQLTPNTVEQGWLSIIDGNQTLRGLARTTNRDLLQLTAAVIPLVESGVVGFSHHSLGASNNKPSRRLRAQQTSSSEVLIAGIDDSPAVCKQLESSLIAVGYRVMTFQNPVKAQSQLLKNPPDLILLDVMMPIVSGYELCNQLRRAPKLKDIPIIILTGKDGWVDRARAKMCGATDFLSKPVQKEKLLETINKYLSVKK